MYSTWLEKAKDKYESLQIEMHKLNKNGKMLVKNTCESLDLAR